MSNENATNPPGKSIPVKRATIWLRRLAILIVSGVLIYGVGANLLLGFFERPCCPTLSYAWYPSWSPDGEQIVFVSYGAESRFGGITRIYVMNSDGTNVRALTSHILDNLSPLRNFYEAFLPLPRDDMPAWSPNGKQIVFARGEWNKDIYVMNADGSNVNRIVHYKIPVSTYSDLGKPLCCFNPDWSPDGKKITFFDEYGGGYVVNTDGTQLDRMPYGNEDNRLSWSPDGRHIVYVITGNIFTATFDEPGNEKQLTEGLGVSNLMSPVWSSDGSQIAFIASIDQHQDGLFVMDADGDNISMVVNQLVYVDDKGNYVTENYLSWSPTDAHFALIGGWEEQGYGLYLFDSDGTDGVKLVNLELSGNRPQVRISWFPDGMRIAFSYNLEMYVIDTEGTVLFQNIGR